MNIRISVIMGIYNCETTLSEAIDSILLQTYTGWKLIMCDDGSTDDTYAVAKQYRDKYPDKIFLLKNEKNMGLNYTLNRCLEEVDTEFVSRMDGDDISLPERFDREITFLDEHLEYSIVSCPMIYFDENGDFRQGRQYGEPKLEQYVKGTPFCHAPCMVRREAYAMVEGYTVNKQRLRVEDWDIWIRMREYGFRGFNLAEPLYKMRDDRNAFRRRKFKNRINEVRVAVSAVRRLKLSPFYYLWCVRPIVVGLLPNFIYLRLHKNR